MIPSARPRLLQALTALESERSRVERFMIVQGAAKDLKVHPKTVWKWIDEVAMTLPPKRERCVECGEYRRVHKIDGHPFTTSARDSQGRYEKWARGYLTENQRHAFIDGLREVLDLDPLYKQRTNALRFTSYPEPKLFR